MLLCALLVWQPAALLRTALWLAGRDDLTFDQLELGLNELDLTGLRIGGAADQRVGRVHLSYRVGDLLRGRIARVSVEGVTLRGRLNRDGVQLEGLDLTSGAAEPTGLPALPFPDEISVRDVQLELVTPLGVLAVPLEAELRPEQDRAAFVIDAEGAELAAPEGQLRLDLRAEGTAPLVPETLVAQTALSGRVQLRADQLSVPEMARGVDGSSELTFSLKNGQFHAELAAMRLRVQAIAPEWDAVAEVMPVPWQLDVAPATISATLRGEEVVLEGSGRLGLAAAGPQLDAAVGATARLDGDGRLRELALADGQLDLRELRWGDVRLEGASIRAEGAGAPEAWQGALDFDLAGGGSPWPGLTFDRATGRGTLDVRFEDDGLDVLAREATALELAGLSWAEDVRIDGLEMRLQPDAAPLLSVQMAGDVFRWQQDLQASLPAFEAAVTAGGSPWELTGQLEELQVELTGDRAGLDGGRVTLGGGAVRLPAYDVRLDGIAAEAQLSATGLLADQPVPISIAAIAHDGAPAWVAPLRLDGSVQPQGDLIGFDATIAQARGPVSMRVRGQHDLASARGRADVDLPPVAFAPGQLEPGQLSPLLGDFVSDVSGRLALDGSVEWGAADGVAADLGILVEGLAFTSGPARFEQVNGVVRLDRLVPPSTPPGQELAVGLVDVGLPLINGLATFQLDSGQLLVEQLRWQFAEGWIEATPFTVGSGEISFATTLSAERLQLDEIFALAQLEGLSGEGTMHGTLPITVSGAEAVIKGGELVSDGPGWVRYRPPQVPAALQAGGENVNLLLQALENFRYEQLRLTIDGRTDGQMDVGLHIAGANPDLLGGHPIEFNLNLEGALAAILRASLAGYHIPESIRRQMQGFGR